MVDAHGSERALVWLRNRGRDYDSIIVGGDLAKGRAQGFVERFLNAAVASVRRVFFVQGNWDAPQTPVPQGVVPLHGKTDMIGEYSIGGLGGSNPTPFSGPFEMSENEARSVLDGLGHVDILVSHCPPASTKCDRAHTGHIGSVPVREYVKREGPQLVLSGHVHESRAIDRLGGSTVINPGPIMDGNYAEVYLDGIVSVELKTVGGIQH